MMVWNCGDKIRIWKKFEEWLDVFLVFMKVVDCKVLVVGQGGEVVVKVWLLVEINVEIVVVGWDIELDLEKIIF